MIDCLNVFDMAGERDRRQAVDMDSTAGRLVDHLYKARTIDKIVVRGRALQPERVRVRAGHHVEIADRVEEAIRYNRNSVPGKNSDNPHLYQNDRYEDGDSITVKYWSDQGFFHDCWFQGQISRDGSVEFDHCGCNGMYELESLVRAEI